MVNHPALLAELGEEFGALDLAAGELDRLRQEILKTWHSALETEALQSQLRESGFSGILERLLSREVYTMAPFAGPSAEIGDAREGWRQSYAFFSRRRRGGKEVEEAVERFAAEPSERNAAYLAAVTKAAATRVDEDAESAGEISQVTEL
jgi:hypothetical protein